MPCICLFVFAHKITFILVTRTTGGIYPETKKGATQMFSTIQVTPSRFPVFMSGTRKTSLQDLIPLNNLGIPNKRKVLCQGFYKEPGIAD